MACFVEESNRLNEEFKFEKLPYGVIEIRTLENNCLLVNQSIWECHMPVISRSISLPLVAAKLVAKFMTGEMRD